VKIEKAWYVDGRKVMEYEGYPGLPFFTTEDEAIEAALENCRQAREKHNEEVLRSEEKLNARLRAIQNDGKET